MKKILIAVLLTVMIIGNVSALSIDFVNIPADWPGCCFVFLSLNFGRHRLYGARCFYYG